uniref:Thoeris protein ThsB TIR-like domain-containing protein n=1 Tax=Rhizobium rhizogenes TaxID=359 RepID=A0A7S4ZTZ8_RHIRH|nr:hypothetical protein pC6.5d_718 [Rhizobium rhizogenes]
MSLHQVHVFISHSWTYSGHYKTISSWIFDNNWRFGQAVVDFRNYSVPETNPILDAPNDKMLKEAIHRQIARSHVIVIPTGMYTHYSKWIGKEIDGSVQFGKPILAVNLRGAQRTASVVGRAASDFVAWNSSSVVTGIWNLYNQ